MVVGTVVGVTAIVASGGAATPAVVAAATEGIALGTAGATAAATSAVATGTAVAGATGTAVAAGACTGAVAGSSVGSAVVGAVVSGSSAAGISSLGGGAAAATTTGLAMGPVGWICLGAEEKEEGGETRLSFDCWKSVLHDKSVEPSRGKLMRDVFTDERIKEVTVTREQEGRYPGIRLKNVWDQEFEVQYVLLPWGELAATKLRQGRLK